MCERVVCSWLNQTESPVPELWTIPR
jgi:hypothetical protein